MTSHVFAASGKLFIVATPIGNLKDISQRALETMQHVALIAAEDTRHSGKLMQHYGITTPMQALHEHNELHQAPKLIQRMREGSDIALISDAGTPLVSDPGLNLVRLAREAGIVVVPVPGASAAITALSVAGLPSDRFCFEGFLSAKSGARERSLMALASETRSLIFYEAPHRIVASCLAMRDVFGSGRRAVIARELTKRFETVHGATLGELCEWLQADENQQKGEFVVIVHGAEAEDPHELDDETRHLIETLLEELPLKQAVSLAVRISGLKKNAIYQYAVSLKSADD